MGAILYTSLHLKDVGPDVEAELFRSATTDKLTFLARFVKYLGALGGGLKIGHLRVDLETGGTATRASQTIACSNAAITNGDTLTIGGVVLTVAAAPANENEWAEGASDALSAVALAACINANSKLKGLLIASISVAGTVLLTFLQPGRMGNLITLATSDAAAFTLGGATLTGGVSTQQIATRSFEYGMTG